MPLFNDVVHVKTAGWIDWNDYRIFMAAHIQNYDTVITLDEDFNKLLLEHGCPPKVIWLKVGNCSTSKLADIITLHRNIITDFLNKSSDFECL